jgi:hypothetical protein
MPQFETGTSKSFHPPFVKRPFLHYTHFIADNPQRIQKKAVSLG